MLFLTENYAALHILQLDLLFDKKNPPFVLFGSSFPKDREYTQVCWFYYENYCIIMFKQEFLIKEGREYIITLTIGTEGLSVKC